MQLTRPAKSRISACVSYWPAWALLTLTTSNLFVVSFQWKIRLMPAHLHHSKHLQQGFALPQPCFVILATYRSAPFTLGSRLLADQDLAAAPPSANTEKFSGDGDNPDSLLLLLPEPSLPLTSPPLSLAVDVRISATASIPSHPWHRTLCSVVLGSRLRQFALRLEI